jgi:hypothetical protein
MPPSGCLCQLLLCLLTAWVLMLKLAPPSRCHAALLPCSLTIGSMRRQSKANL